MKISSIHKTIPTIVKFGFGMVSVALIASAYVGGFRRPHGDVHAEIERSVAPTRSVERAAKTLVYKPRQRWDSGGYSVVSSNVIPWGAAASLGEIAGRWSRVGYRIIDVLDTVGKTDFVSDDAKISRNIAKAMLYQFEGEPKRSYELLEATRTMIEREKKTAREKLYTVIFFQGVAALRMGENENCIACRGESSCILPISRAAIHTVPRGSRAAIRHFTEYLEMFPEDLEVKWLLNLAHMTLGEHPAKVDPRFVISLDRFRQSEFDIGKFRDVGHLVGVNRFNQAGGAILEDFNNDGLLDLAVSCYDPTALLTIYLNQGNGVFRDVTDKSELSDQFGGLQCVQTDYNNDGYMDLFIVRGAWLEHPVRPSLIRNNGDGTFTDVTERAGLLDPVNSNTASWADYDNDGLLDVFIGCEKQRDRLYHNRGDGTFEEVSFRAGLTGTEEFWTKGSTWIDYDNDDYPDLFINHLNGSSAELYRNNRNGTFTDVTVSMGVNGPRHGFSCWAWDYDNDGLLDLFSTSYEHTTEDVVKGLIGVPHGLESNKLYHNVGGKKFEDVTKKAGLDLVFMAMGSNYGDFDNDGFLDMYLGTGDPNIASLVPNRMFKNVGGERFAEITGTSGTGHLQKGHGVACGDWDRDGDVDIFIEMGGAINGDKYHNILFNNPGQGNSWLTVRLKGVKTNRAAIGARIKATTAGDQPLTVHRHVSSGSSFGGNPLEQSIGLGKAERVATLEIHWPTSGTTQVFQDVAANQYIEVTEFAENYRRLDLKPIATPSAEEKR